MSEAAIIFLLILCIILLFSIILYQRFHFKKGIHARLKEVSDKLEDILVSGSDEKVMVFTDDSALMELSGQINLLLEGYQKIKVDYRRSQAASKKMLSNISHDIKTPMTVILGYLEMIRLESPEENELLEKVEEKARKMMELISQFFTLAKLEAGDTSLELSSVSLNECCREAVLDFYELLTQKNFQVEVGKQGRPGTDSGKSHIKCRPLWRRRQISGSFSSFGRKICLYRHIRQGQRYRQSLFHPDFRPSLHPGGFPEPGNTG